MEKFIIKFNIDSIQQGINILTIVMNPILPKKKLSAVNHKLEFGDIDMNLIRLIRGCRKRRKIEYTQYLKRYPITKTSSLSFYLAYKNGKIGIYNNTTNVKRGIIFNHNKPIHYKVSPKTVSIFEYKINLRCYHLSIDTKDNMFQKKILYNNPLTCPELPKLWFLKNKSS